jgi:hypothetical protein
MGLPAAAEQNSAISEKISREMKPKSPGRNGGKGHGDWELA